MKKEVPINNTKKNTNFKHFVIFVLSDLIQLVKVK
jgi:hypothetical protein